MSFRVSATPTAKRQADALRGKAAKAYEDALLRLEAEGCAAADYRLTGEAVDHICSAHLYGNFGVLINDLAGRLRRAQAVEQDRRTRNRTRQIVDGFLGDRPNGSSRDAAVELIHEIESALEDTFGDEEVRRHLSTLTREFELGIDPQAPVPRYEDFKDGLSGLDAIRREAYRQRTQSLVTEKSPRSNRRSARKVAAVGSAE